MKDMREGDKARWNSDALHSIMLMSRIIMSSPSGSGGRQSGCGHKLVSLFVCVCTVKAGMKPNLLKVILLCLVSIHFVRYSSLFMKIAFSFSHWLSHINKGGV